MEIPCHYVCDLPASQKVSRRRRRYTALLVGWLLAVGKGRAASITWQKDGIKSNWRHCHYSLAGGIRDLRAPAGVKSIKLPNNSSLEAWEMCKF